MLSVRSSSSRTVMNLDGVWRFQLDPDDHGRSEHRLTMRAEET
ncbi:hypothetical protein [Actinomyces sp. MRS3W]|nr:hypothetical protein [Actinomyces sp. MRS3W]MDU0347229.1 hypothetical protein [Actinomyces sp. MRS3W]